MSSVVNKNTKWSMFLKFISPKIPNKRQIEEYRQLFYSISDKLAPCDSVFLSMFDDVSQIDFVEDTVVIFYVDILDPSVIDQFNHTFRKHRNKKFYLFHDKAHLDLHINNDNVKFYTVGLGETSINDLLDHANYVNEKNFDTERVGIVLNRLLRNHRCVLLAYLLGTGMDEYCNITAPLINAIKEHRQTDDVDILNLVHWDFYEYSDSIRQGWQRALKNDGIMPTVDAYDPVDQITPKIYDNQNLENFELRLTPIYKNSFVEIVTESEYDYKLFFFTEKYPASQFGKNFPLLHANVNLVNYLRDWGFDMFDDIIDNAYSSELDPVKRMVMMIESNKHLFVNQVETKKLWIENNHRFEHNIQCVRDLWKSIKSKINQEWMT